MGRFVVLCATLLWDSVHLTAARDYMLNFETIWLHCQGEMVFFFYEELKR